MKPGLAALTPQSKNCFGTSTVKSGENPVLQGIKLQNEAILHAEKFEFQDALAKAAEAEEITEKSFGPSHTYTAEALMKTAEYYDILGYFEKAMSDSKQAVEILKEHAKTHRPSLAAALSINSRALANGGIYFEALNVEELAYQIKRDMFGENNIQTFLSLCELGERHRLVGDLTTATEVLTNCLQMSEQFNEAAHLEKYILHLSLAELSIDKKDYDQANYHADRMLVGMKEEHINKSLLTGRMHNIIGEIELKEKDYESALEALEVSKGFYEKVFAGSHPDFAMTLTYMARCYHDMGYPERARNIQEDAIKMFNNFSADVTHPQYLIMNLLLANIMRHSHDKTGAQKLAEESYNQLENKLGKTHPKSLAYAHIITNYNGDTTGVL